MVKNKIISISIITVLVIGGFFLYRYFFPNTERKIIRHLNSLVETVSFARSENSSGQIATALWAERLAEYFTENATIMLEDVTEQIWSLNGREQLKQTMLAARPRLESLDVSISDPVVSVKSSTVGEATVTIKARWQEGELDSNFWAREAVFELEKRDQQWLIIKVESVPVIRR